MQKNSETVQPRVGNWVVRNVEPLKTFMRTILGVVWLIDGALKFQPGFAEAFPDMVTSAGQGQPSWLQPWFSFWATSTTGNPAAIVYTIGTLELLLGLALVLGFLRKLVYIGGMIYSLFIWAVPEGFGGPYGPASTDIGTGIIYGFLFLALIIINATYGTSKYSLDALIEQRFPSWKRLAEFGLAAK